MARKKKEKESASTPAYMLTFGDLMNLLLVVFIAIIGSMTINVPKFKMMIGAFQRQLGIMPRSVSVLNTGEVLVPGRVSEIRGNRTFVEITKEAAAKYKEYEKRLGGLVEIANELKGGTGEKPPVEVTVLPGGQGVSIKFNDKVTFDLGKADIKTEFRMILDKFAGKLKEILDKYKDTRIYIEGHTDSVPLQGGIYGDNWGLSSARALAVLRYFEGRKYTPSQMMAVGLADTVPDPQAEKLCGKNPNCPVNRRIVIRIQSVQEGKEVESITTYSEGAAPTTQTTTSETAAPPRM